MTDEPRYEVTARSRLGDDVPLSSDVGVELGTALEQVESVAGSKYEPVEFTIRRVD